LAQSSGGPDRCLALFFRGNSMTFQFALLPKHLLRVGIVAIATIGASACSTVPNWVDPTNWIGGSDDQTAPPDPSDQASDNGQTPDLSTIPDKPGAPSTADEQRDVAQSLQGDRTRAQYSGDALKGGTEPTAAPPPAEAAPSTEELASNDASPAAPPPAPAAALPPQSSAPGTLPSDSAPAAPTPPPQTQVAAVEMPSPAAAPSAGPAVPAAPALVPNRLAPFRPSNAPPLDASVAQFVPPSILARYRQTAAMGPQTAVPAADTAMASNLDTTKTRRRTHATAMGAPEAMSGAVVANFDAPAAGSAAVPPAADGILGSPAAVVYFSSDTTALSADARAQVQAAAKAFMAQGAQGYVRIIGHSSGRMGGMTASRYLVWNFERSLARANAVAKALIKAGVPADKVLVQAVEDGQSANPGDDGGRRAEIFFQS